MIIETHRDLAPERHERLRDLVRERGVVRVDEICAALSVSSATARRDLETLETQGLLRRVHGGAVSVETRLEEPFFDDKAARATSEKKRIALAALALVQSGETIYLDGGSTVLELARLLAPRTDLTVVTNSLRAASELSGRGPQVILVGGELRRRSQTMVGSLTRMLLSQVHFDRAFMGTMGLTAEGGMTTTDPNEAFTKKLVCARAREVVLLVDHSKIGKVCFAAAGPLRQVHTLISDRALEPTLARACAKLKINVIRA